MQDEQNKIPTENGRSQSEPAAADEQKPSPTADTKPLKASPEFMNQLDEDEEWDTLIVSDEIRGAADTMPLPPIETTSDDENDTPPSSLPRPTEPYIRIARRCDIGAVRKRNEDSCFTFTSHTGGEEPLIPFALIIVADGMGGHHAGHDASRTVSRTIGRHVLERIYLPLIRGQQSHKPVQEIMRQAVEEANRNLYTPDPEKEGGTTLTAGVIVGRRLYLMHVGDSRAYLLTDDEMKQLTTDHTVVHRLQEAGHITAEQAATHPHRNLLYRAVNGQDLDVDMHTRSLPHRGRLLLCSDGLWGVLEDERMQAVVQDHTISIESQCDKLVDMAIKNGSTDNVTAVLADFRL